MESELRVTYLHSRMYHQSLFYLLNPLGTDLILDTQRENGTAATPHPQ